MSLASAMDTMSSSLARSLGQYCRLSEMIEPIISLLDDPISAVHNAALVVIGNLTSCAFDPQASRSSVMAMKFDIIQRVLPHLEADLLSTRLFAAAAMQNLCSERCVAESAVRFGAPKILEKLVRIRLDTGSTNTQQRCVDHITRFAANALNNISKVMETEDASNGSAPPERNKSKHPIGAKAQASLEALQTLESVIRLQKQQRRKSAMARLKREKESTLHVQSMARVLLARKRLVALRAERMQAGNESAKSTTQRVTETEARLETSNMHQTTTETHDKVVEVAPAGAAQDPPAGRASSELTDDSFANIPAETLAENGIDEVAKGEIEMNATETRPTESLGVAPSTLDASTEGKSSIEKVAHEPVEPAADSDAAGASQEARGVSADHHGVSADHTRPPDPLACANDERMATTEEAEACVAEKSTSSNTVTTEGEMDPGEGVQLHPSAEGGMTASVDGVLHAEKDGDGNAPDPTPSPHEKQQAVMMLAAEVSTISNAERDVADRLGRAQEAVDEAKRQWGEAEQGTPSLSTVDKHVQYQKALARLAAEKANEAALAAVAKASKAELHFTQAAMNATSPSRAQHFREQADRAAKLKAKALETIASLENTVVDGASPRKGAPHASAIVD